MKTRGMWESPLSYLWLAIPLVGGWCTGGVVRWSFWIWLALVSFPVFLKDSSRLRYRAAMVAYAVYLITTCILTSILFAIRYPFVGRTTANLLWTTGLCQFIGKLIGLQCEVRNVERLRGTEKVILVCNHMSNLDFYSFSFIPYVRGGKTAIVCKKEIKYFFSVGWVAAFCRMIFVDRMSKKNAFEDLLESSRRHLDSPGMRAILICPEGTRGSGKELLPFKRGAFEIAVRLNVPVLAYVSSPYPVKPPYYFYRGTLIFEVLEPIFPKEGETPQELSDRTRTAMVKVFNQLRQETGL